MVMIIKPIDFKENPLWNGFSTDLNEKIVSVQSAQTKQNSEIKKQNLYTMPNKSA